MSENSCSLDFYNMLVHIVFKNRVSEENVAVKNAWEKNGTLFFDLYFYRAKKGKLLDAALVRDLYDLNTEKYYYSAQNFYQDFLQSRRLAAEQAEEIKKPSPVVIDVKQLEAVRDDLIILIFLAKCNANFTDIKNRAIREYVTRVRPQSQALSEQYVNSYLKSLNPDEEDFYRSLNNLKAKTPEEAAALAVDAFKVSAADGAVLYNERLYLAELLQTLREYGLEPDVGF
jgi:hypothetical protein